MGRGAEELERGAEAERGFGVLLDLGGGDAVGEFDDFEAGGGDVEDAEVGDDSVDDGGAGEGESAGAEDFGGSVGGGVLHDDDYAADSGDEVHSPAHAFDPLAGDHPVGEVAVLGDLHGSEDGEVDVAAADHGEGVGGGEGGGSGDEGDGFFAGVDEVGVDFGVEGERAHAEEAVFGLQGDGHAGGDVVGDEGGDAYAEIDVVAVLQFLGGTGGELVAGQGHAWGLG